MKNHLKYKGYTGTVEFSIEDNLLYGKIIKINDLVNYEAKSIKKLNKVFIESVDDYIQTKKDLIKTETYRVLAKTTTYCYIDVVATSQEEAEEMGQKIDGGDFITEDDSGWEIYAVIKQ